MEDSGIAITKPESVGIIRKIVILTLVISTITDFYGYGTFNFTYITSVILAIVCFVKNKGIRNVMPRFLTLYLVYYAIAHFISISNDSLVSILPLGLIKIFLVYAMLFYEFDFQTFHKYYYYVALICIAFFLVQFFVLTFMGINLPGIVPGLPTIMGEDGAMFNEEKDYSKYVSSFFSEKAKFAQFLLPLLCIELFGVVKRRWMFILLIVVCIVLTSSGNGFLGLIVISFFYIVHSIRNGITFRKVLMLLVLGMVSFVLVGYYLTTERGEEVIERQDQLTESEIGEASSGQSGFIRIYSGYYVFSDYSLWEQIVGINSSEGLRQKIDDSSVGFLFDEDNLYFNNFFSILVRTGYIGLVLMILLIVSLWKKTDVCGHSLLCLYVALSFIASFYFINFMAIYFILPYYFSTEKKKII